MVKPIQCHLWMQEVTDDDLKDISALVETYSEDDHFSRRLFRCTRCGQMYLKEFREEVDWVDGEDPQYTTWLPVEDEGEARKIHQSNPRALPKGRPQLKSDWPKGEEKRIYWVGR